MRPPHRKSTDTVAYCQIAMNDMIQMNSFQPEAAKNLEGSRMGIYEHIGMEGPHIHLRELIANDQLHCHCPSGYRGQKGELSYVRLVPPLEPQLAIYWVAMTTPYVLLGASKADWIAFLKRTMVQCDGPNDRTRLNNLLKRGLGDALLERVCLQGIRQLPSGRRFPDRHPGHESHAAPRIARPLIEREE